MDYKTLGLYWVLHVVHSKALRIETRNRFFSTPFASTGTCNLETGTWDAALMINIYVLLVKCNESKHTGPSSVCVYAYIRDLGSFALSEHIPLKVARPSPRSGNQLTCSSSKLHSMALKLFVHSLKHLASPHERSHLGLDAGPGEDIPRRPIRSFRVGVGFEWQVTCNIDSLHFQAWPGVSGMMSGCGLHWYSTIQHTIGGLCMH